MAELTPEERERIYLEEKERFRAQEKVKKENQFSGGGCASGCLLAVIIVATFVAFTPSSHSPSSVSSTTPYSPVTGTYSAIADKEALDKSKVKMGEYRWEYEDSYDYIRGNVVNYSSRPVSYWLAQCHFYDKNGSEIDSQITNSTDTLLPGAAKRFEIMHSRMPQAKKIRMEVTEVRFKDE